MNLELLDKIQQEVGEWSRQNFGDQRSKFNSFQLLYSTAPLLGMVEEMGELQTAQVAGSTEDIKDAIGDEMVYLCDWATRDGRRLRNYIQTKPDPGMIDGCWWSDGEDGNELLAIGVGAMAHAHLKRHQSIRNFNEPDVYNAHITRAINVVIHSLAKLSQKWLGQPDPVLLLEETWNAVKQRNWKADPTKGGQGARPSGAAVAKK